MGKTYLGSNKRIKMYLQGKAVKEMYFGNLRVYPNAEIVTYVVDTGITYTEEVNIDESCLSPKTFTPSKSGWTFIGWREDTAANSTVLTNKVVTSGISITLYAVFRAGVTLSYNANGGTSTPAAQTGYRYYNNGNVVNPTFKLANAISRGQAYAFANWRSGSTSGTAYNAGTNITISQNTTMYATWTAVVYAGYTCLATASRAYHVNTMYLDGEQNDIADLIYVSGGNIYFRRACNVTITVTKIESVATYVPSGSTNNYGRMRIRKNGVDVAEATDNTFVNHTTWMQETVSSRIPVPWTGNVAAGNYIGVYYSRADGYESYFAGTVSIKVNSL